MELVGKQLSLIWKVLSNDELYLKHIIYTDMYKLITVQISHELKNVHSPQPLTCNVMNGLKANAKPPHFEHLCFL